MITVVRRRAPDRSAESTGSAKEEAERIAGCVESVASVSDETLVDDSDSSDEPVVIAQRLGCWVLVNSWSGHGPQRNFGADHAIHDLILWLDADERVGDLGRSLAEWKRRSPAGAVAFRVRRIGDFVERWPPEAAEVAGPLYDCRRCGVLAVALLWSYYEA
jgi:glycosyltransferase involved in cell wall biosynthesis